MNNTSINVGIVGATGAVGQELLQLLHDRKFPLASLRLFASARSVGKVIGCGGRRYTVEEAKPGVFAGVDVAFFAAGGAVTRALAPDAVRAGCLVTPAGSSTKKIPSAPVTARATSGPPPTLINTTAPATGRGAQAGSGGSVSTGQTGPASAIPAIQVRPAPIGLGQAWPGTGGPASDTTDTAPSAPTA